MLLSAPFQARNVQLDPRPEVEYCLQCAVCGLVCVVKCAEAYEPRHTFVYDLFNKGVEARETLGLPLLPQVQGAVSLRSQALGTGQRAQRALFQRQLGACIFLTSYLRWVIITLLLLAILQGVE